MVSYIEQCKAKVASINPDELAAFLLGPEVGRASVSFRFHRIGQLGIVGGQQWLGAKLPRIATHDVYDRLSQEAAFLTLCLDAQPQLAPSIPNFMGIVAVEGTHTRAFLTEDASRGGQCTISARPASADARTMLYVPFSHLGGPGDVLSQDELNLTTSFDAGGQERLLDFTPAPIRDRYLWDQDSCPEYWQLKEAVNGEVDAFTVTVPYDSPLGLSIDAHNLL